MELIQGNATIEGTKSYADLIWEENPKISPNSWRVAEGFTVGKIGFGTYRMHGEHQEMVENALLNGVNLIDTSSNYMEGKAEEVVGEALKKLVGQGKLSREQVVVVTKGGYIQGESFLQCQQSPPVESIQIGEGVMHCIHPDFLETQLHNSLQRIGVETVDFYLLHNPEYYLIHAQQQELDEEKAKSEYYRRIEEAFVFLENKVLEGKIQYYGISSNTLNAAHSDYIHTDLAKIFEVAQRAAQKVWNRKKRPMFRCVQMPLNLLELSAVHTPNTHAKTFDGEEIVPTLELASRMNLTVLTNRPLNAFTEGGVFRLAEVSSGDAQPVTKVIEEIKNLEKIINSLIGGWPQVGEDKLFNFTENCESFTQNLGGSPVCEHLVYGFILPYFATIHDVLGQLSENSEQKDKILNARNLYHELGLELQKAVIQYGKEQDSELVKPVVNELRSRLNGEWLDVPLQQIALNAVASLPGVSCTLCGLRSLDYLDDVKSIYEKGDFKDPAKVIGSQH